MIVVAESYHHMKC